MAAFRAIYDATRYGYAIGRVRVLESHLLSHATYERLLDAGSFAEQRRILSETPYGVTLENVETGEDVERALDAALGDLYADFLERANLPEAIVSYFRIMHDFENLRGILKAEALGLDSDTLTTTLGSAVPDVMGGSYAGMPEVLREAAMRTYGVVTGASGDIEVALIDPAVDAEMYAALVVVAEDSGSPFLSKFARLSADLANLKISVRARAIGLSATEFENLLVPGGDVPLSAFVAGYKVPLEEMVRRVTALPGFHNLDPEALCDLERLDHVIEQTLANQVRAARAVPIGPEPVLGYVATRKAEMRTLRVLLIGRLAGVPTDVLRSRLRDAA